MKNKYNKNINRLRVLFLISLAVVLPVFISCRTILPQKKKNTVVSSVSVQKKYELVNLKSEQCGAFLAPIDINNIRYVPNAKIIFISGSKEQ